ncbi:FecR family protein [Patescibacteria group bacterium]|nr:FecR family protein [Patescibacteria group bacterium]
MNPLPPARSSKDYLLPFLIILSVGLIAALLIRVWGLWGEEEGGALTLSGKAELNEIAGEVEIYLPVVGAWKITQTATSVSIGESVRTNAEGSATLTFDDETVLNLASSSELRIEDLRNSLTKKEAHLTLIRGIAGVTSGTTNADFEITSEFLKISDSDGKFILNSAEKEVTASAIVGGFTATILDLQNPKNPELKKLVVEAGETLEISERRVNLLRIGGEADLVKTTPDTILNSKFYLAMTGESLDDLESSEDSETTEISENAAPAVILPAPLVETGGGNILAVAEPVKVNGKVAPEIVKVEVAFENADAFALSKFEAGSGEWNYNAARDFGNLKIGVNNYTVVGFDAEGNKTPPANFQIIFNPEGVADVGEESSTSEPENSVNQEPGTTNQVDGVPAIGGETFAAPTVNEPEDGATFTEAPIHLEGTVPAGTKEVLVNEYTLSRFEAGSTSWYYNASPEYENLEVGENEFEIVAVSETGDRSSVTIKITYSPEEETEE